VPTAARPDGRDVHRPGLTDRGVTTRAGQREYDVIVLGGADATGQEVASYLSKRRSEVGVRWAAATQDNGHTHALLDGSSTLSADIGNARSLGALASRADVVLNLVGPYSRSADRVIDACIENGSHYVDLCRSIPVMDRIIARHDRDAAEAGVKVVQTGGCVTPLADIAVLLASEILSARCRSGLAEADLEFVLLSPRGRLIPLHFISLAVLRRSVEMAAERGCDTPPLLRYSEMVALPRSALSLPIRRALAGTLGAARRLSLASSVRTAGVRARRLSLRRSREERLGSGWRWRLSVQATATSGERLQIGVEAGGRSPQATAASLLGETGLLLADGLFLPNRGGCLTPAAALGSFALGRYRAAGVRFSLSPATQAGADAAAAEVLMSTGDGGLLLDVGGRLVHSSPGSR